METSIRRCIWGAAAAVGLLSGVARAGVGPGTQNFSVQDSIELARIVDPTLWSVNEERAARPILSPDGEHYVLVTQRGVLSDDRIEATVWLFERSAVAASGLGTVGSSISPRAIARLSASTNAPVIADVRWLSDSRRIAFIGRNEAMAPQLFILDVLSGGRSVIGAPSEYVTAYDVSGDTIAYTSEVVPCAPKPPTDDLQSVTDQGGIYQLLYPPALIAAEMDDEAHSLSCPNDLHVVRGGAEVRENWAWNGRPLRLYDPVLSLAPDGNSLITVAPVDRVPTAWAAYSSGEFYVGEGWSSTNEWQTDARNPWKAQEYVLVDLRTHRVRSLIDAPAGPGTFYFLYAATRILWSKDEKRVILSNAMLPAREGAPFRGGGIDHRIAAVAEVDLSTGIVQPIANVPKSKERTRYLSDVIWREANGEVDLQYISHPDKIPCQQDRYRFKSGKWVKEPSPALDIARTDRLLVRETLNQPPVLAVRTRLYPMGKAIWDPNPQLASKALGNARMYEWKSRKTGHAWAGVLVLPPGYNATKHYPLVIQTHGYETQRFYTDGIYTTGSGGRALAGADIVVLQTNESPSAMMTPGEGPDDLDKFESAIDQLTSDGIVDPERVGVIGFSYTCFEVLYALTHRPRLFTAATINDGNNKGYLLYLFSVDVGGRDNSFLGPLESTYGSRPFGKGLERWAEETPSFNLDKVQAPVQVWSLERGALMGQWEIYAGLRAWQKPVEMLWLSSQRFVPHVLVKPNDRLISQQGAVDWFRFWLQGYEDPVEGKAKQYARWEKLCDTQRVQTPTRPTFCVGSKE